MSNPGNARRFFDISLGQQCGDGRFLLAGEFCPVT